MLWQECRPIGVIRPACENGARVMSPAVFASKSSRIKGSEWSSELETALYWGRTEVMQ